MTAPMTLEQAAEEARKRGLGPGWIAQVGELTGWGWRFYSCEPYLCSSFWGCFGVTTALGTGAPNPEWRTTLTEVK